MVIPYNLAKRFALMKRARILKPIGELITRIMVEKGIDLSTLADLTGLSNGYLSDLTRGKIDNPSLKVMLKIAEALETDFLIKGTIQPKKEEEEALVYESPFTVEELKEEFKGIDLEEVEVDLDDPAIKLVSGLLNDRKIPIKHRKKIRRYIINLVLWFKEIFEESDT
jgi:transcriptional regulator with XRE-family HTH domain